MNVKQALAVAGFGVVCIVAGGFFARQYAVSITRVPEPTAESTRLVTDPAGRFDLRVATSFEPVVAQPPYYHLDDVAVAYTTDQASYHPMNYGQDAWVVVSTRDGSPDTCYDTDEASGLSFSTPVLIDGTVFKVATSSDAGAGNRYDATVYRTVRDGTCYEIATTLHVSSDWTDVDQNAIDRSQAEGYQMLMSAAESFQFLKEL